MQLTEHRLFISSRRHYRASRPFAIRNRKPDHQRRLLPKPVDLLVVPSPALGANAHVEPVQHGRQNKPHLVVSEAVNCKYALHQNKASKNILFTEAVARANGEGLKRALIVRIVFRRNPALRDKLVGAAEVGGRTERGECRHVDGRLGG